MLNPSFRFVQAADFRLEKAASGLAEVPDHLVEPLIEAAYRAAAGVFDTALAQEAEFLLLAGGLADFERAGPRARSFLHEQFARLAARGVRVYWATGPGDHRRNWPEHWTWPDNVHLFDGYRAESLIHERDGVPLCVVTGRSVDDWSGASSGQAVSELWQLFSSPTSSASTEGLPRVAVTPHDWPATAIEAAFASLPSAAPPHFLALGATAGLSSSAAANRSTPVTLDRPPRIAHHSGTPQGRSLAEPGPHGCTVVTVEPQGTVRLAAMPTDAVRWHDERITLAADALRPDLDRQLHEQMHALLAASPERTLLVRWTIAGDCAWLTGAKHARLAAELQAMLRAEYGLRVPAAWTIGVAIETPSAVRAEWFEEQTLLGDYLRAMRALEASDAADLDLHQYLSAEQRRGPLVAVASLVDSQRRGHVLSEATALGAALLRAEETVS